MQQQWLGRHALTWLLLAQFAVIAPHIERLPLWVDAVWLIAAFWRVRVYQGRWSFPGRIVKFVLVVGSIAGIRYSYKSLLGLEPTVALLIACFSFKLLEAATRREALLLLFLGYFVALTAFLFEQGLGTVAYMLLPIVLLSAALVALHQAPEPQRFTWQPLRAATVLMAQALPLMLLLFLVFPRFAPLWQVPLPGGSARTGMSEEMAPGDIAQLSLSDALAFRAAFAGSVPPARELYWRGMVLDDFDGRRWRASGFIGAPLQDSGAATGLSIDYEIYLEPTYQRWLYALQRPVGTDGKSVATADHRLMARDPVREKTSFRVRSYLDGVLDPQLSAQMRRFALQLPNGSNPRTREWALRLRAEHDDDEAFIDAVLRNFRDEKFYYTLRPPLLGAQPVDEFLFGQRRGFCEHYASSFVFALRAGGIPARVVAGYQGGEINPLTGTVLVHQFDAHAWAEAWLVGRGWVRFDPTAMVAPQRIEGGLEQALASGEFLAQSPLSFNRYRGTSWLNTLRLRADAMNYAWTRWVVNYRDQTQTDVLRSLLGEISPLRIALFLVGGGAAALSIVAAVLLGRQLLRERPTPEQRYYQRFCGRLERHGFVRPPGMAAGDFGRMVLAQRPQWSEVGEVTACFEALSYRRLNAAEKKQVLAKLRLALRRFLRQQSATVIGYGETRLK
jgi:transglutaminase-like putative cysteine protease